MKFDRCEVMCNEDGSLFRLGQGKTSSSYKALDLEPIGYSRTLHEGFASNSHGDAAAAGLKGAIGTRKTWKLCTSTDLGNAILPQDMNFLLYSAVVFSGTAYFLFGPPGAA